MPIDLKELEQLSRDALIAKARALGAERPELLTRPELRDELIRLSTGDGTEATRHARGWFGVARDLVASVVAQGLNLPDTAELIRGVNLRVPKAGPPVATVTLAEIYAAQGHVGKAITLLDEVLAKEPDHEAARSARQRYAPVVAQSQPVVAPEPEDEFNEGESRDAELTPAGTQEPLFESPQQAVGTDTEPAQSMEELEPKRSQSDEGGVDEHPAIQPEQEQFTWGEIEEDSLLIVRGEEKTLRCLWQLGRLSKARWDVKLAGCKLVLKVLEVEARWDGPICRESLVEVDQPQGQRALPVTVSEFRVVLGWLENGTFTPLCLGAEYCWARDTGVKLLWAPPVTQSDEAWERLGRQRIGAWLGVA